MQSFPNIALAPRSSIVQKHWQTILILDKAKDN